MQLTIAVSAIPNGCIAIDTDKLFAVESDRTEFDRLMVASPAMAYIVDYGLKQSLGDATAMTKEKKVGMTPTLYLSLVEKKWEAIHTGKVSTRGPAQPPVDPITAEANKLAKARWAKWTDDDHKVHIAAFRAAYFAGKSAADATDAKVTAFILSQMAAGLRDEAEAIVAKANTVAVDESTIDAAKGVLASLLAS